MSTRSELYKLAKSLGLPVNWRNETSRIASMRAAIAALDGEIEANTPARRPEGWIDESDSDISVERVMEDSYGPYDRVHYLIKGVYSNDDYFNAVDMAIADFREGRSNPDVDSIFHFQTLAGDRRFITLTRDDMIIAALAGDGVQKALEDKLDRMASGEIIGSDEMGADYVLDYTFVGVKTGSLLGEAEGSSTFDFAETMIAEGDGNCFWRSVKDLVGEIGEEAVEAAKPVNTIAMMKDWAAKYCRLVIATDTPKYDLDRDSQIVFKQSVYHGIKLTGIMITDTFEKASPTGISIVLMFKLLKDNKGHVERFVRLTEEQFYVDKRRDVYRMQTDDAGNPIMTLVKRHIKCENVTKKEEKVKRVDIVAFDFETVFDARNAGLLVPYSVSWSVRQNEKRYGDAHFYYGFDCVSVFVDWIAKNQKGRKFVLVGYNSSRFDNFFLINELMRRDMLGECKLVNGSILKMKFSGRHEVFDLCRYLACPLAVACEQFKPVYRKRADLVSHVKIQETYNNEGVKGLERLFEVEEGEYLSAEFDGVSCVDADLPDIAMYNILDVLSTDCLYMMIDKIMRDEGIITKPLYEKSTIGGLAWSLLKSHFKKQKIKLPKLPMDTYKKVRGSLFAGRTQTYKGLHSETSGEQQYDMYDAKSLYPYVYLNRLFPCGEILDIRYEECLERGLMGFYEVDFDQKGLRVKVLPKRAVGEPLDWNYDGRMTMMVNTVDIAQLIRHGATIHYIGDGFAFKSTIRGDKLFAPMLTCKNIKEAEDRKPVVKRNNVLRNMSKLLINSASGKVIQRVFTKTEKICKSEAELAAVHETITNVSWERSVGNVSIVSYEKSFEESFKRQNMPIYLGCFIYSHARAHMMNSVLVDYDGIYQDTDSLLMPRAEAERFAREKPHLIGGEFGQFELEDTKGKDIAKIVVIAPKCYFLFSKDDQLLKRGFKGVNMRGDKILTEEDVAEMVEDWLAFKSAKDGKVTLIGDIERQFNAYHVKYAHRSLAKPENIAMLCNSLKEGRTAHVLTSSLRKSVETLSINQRFTIKNINVKSL